MKHKSSYLLALCSMAMLMVSGCNTGAIPTSNARISATLTPDASAERVSQFEQLAGLNPAGAAFLASTELQISSHETNTYQFTATFPGNAKAEMTLRITPDQRYAPTSDERASQGKRAYNASLVHSMSGSTYKLTLRYFLPNDAIAGVSDGAANGDAYEAAVGGGAGSRIQPVAYRKAGDARAAASSSEGGGEETGMIVELQAAVSEAGHEFISKFEEVVIKEGVGEKLAEKIGNPLSKTVYSSLEAFEVLESSLEYQELVSQLDELQMEAEYPSNALTQKAYAENPGLKQNILNEIDAARSDLKWEALASYTSTEVSVALGLVEVPGLTVILAPITKWNVETAKDLMKQRVAEIRKMVATGEVNTDPPTGNSASTATPSTTPETGAPTQTPKPGQWSATYHGQHTTVYPDGTTINITDKGSVAFTITADGSVVGTGNGNVVFHSQGPDGSYGDGETAYAFTIAGEYLGGQVQLTVEEGTVPPVFNVVGVAKDGHRETTVQPVVAPLLPRDPVDLKHGGTAKTEEDTNGGGMQIAFVAVITVN